MGKLTDRAAFMELCNDWLRDTGWSLGTERAGLAAAFWDRLARAGLAEEKREPGFYPVSGSETVPLAFWSGTRWLRVGVYHDQPAGVSYQDTPAIIGPRIEPPKD